MSSAPAAGAGFVLCGRRLLLFRTHSAGELRLTLQEGPAVARSPLVYELAPHIQ